MSLWVDDIYIKRGCLIAEGEGGCYILLSEILFWVSDKIYSEIWKFDLKKNTTLYIHSPIWNKKRFTQLLQKERPCTWSIVSYYCIKSLIFPRLRGISGYNFKKCCIWFNLHCINWAYLYVYKYKWLIVLVNESLNPFYDF